jgi:hypothetical protein
MAIPIRSPAFEAPNNHFRRERNAPDYPPTWPAGLDFLALSLEIRTAIEQTTREQKEIENSSELQRLVLNMQRDMNDIINSPEADEAPENARRNGTCPAADWTAGREIVIWRDRIP